jgi:hypothetical protein
MASGEWLAETGAIWRYFITRQKAGDSHRPARARGNLVGPPGPAVLCAVATKQATCRFRLPGKLNGE